MSTVKTLRIIEPQRVAEKLESIRNFLLPDLAEDIAQNPRFVEAVWFLSWVSFPENYAGGLAKFTSDFIEENRHRIGPACLVDKGPRVLTTEEAAEVQDALIDPDAIIESESSKRLLAAIIDSTEGILSESEKTEIRGIRSTELAKLNYQQLQAPCIDAAREHLATYFFNVCTDPETRFLNPCGTDQSQWFRRGRTHGAKNALWYFPQLWTVFFEWLDARAAKIRTRIAPTSVTREVYRWLRLAQEARKGIMFVGNSRYGKTEAIRAWAEMSPGRVRIIETPSSSSEGDLLREIARALGLRYSPTSTSFHELRTSIDYVLRHSGLMLIFDEAQFLFPSAVRRRSDPPRLNYVRRAIMDLGLPTAFVCTPQSWSRVEKNYLKATGFTIEQFEGRLLRSAVFLVEELPREEMIDVARVHLPDLSADGLEYVVKLVRTFQGSVLSCIENVARLSKIYAEENGRDKAKFSDIKQAIHDVLPARIPSEPIEQPEAPAVPEERQANPVRRSTAPALPASPMQSHRLTGAELATTV